MTVDLHDLSRRLFNSAEQFWTNTALRPNQYAQAVLALIAPRQIGVSRDLLLPRVISEQLSVEAAERELQEGA